MQRIAPSNRATRREAEKELSTFLTNSRPVLEHAEDLPADYVDLLGQTAARALVARAAAWIEHSFDSEQTAEALRAAARADVAEATELPPAWLDAKDADDAGAAAEGAGVGAGVNGSLNRAGAEVTPVREDADKLKKPSATPPERLWPLSFNSSSTSARTSARARCSPGG